MRHAISEHHDDDHDQRHTVRLRVRAFLSPRASASRLPERRLKAVSQRLGVGVEHQSTGMEERENVGVVGLVLSRHSDRARNGGERQVPAVVPGDSATQIAERPHSTLHWG